MAERQPVHQERRVTSVIGRTFQYAGLAVLILLAVFLLQNLQSAEVNFLWFQWTVRMVWALLVSAVFGAIGAVLAYVVIARLRRADRRE